MGQSQRIHVFDQSLAVILLSAPSTGLSDRVRQLRLQRRPFRRGFSLARILPRATISLGTFDADSFAAAHRTGYGFVFAASETAVVELLHRTENRAGETATTATTWGINSSIIVVETKTATAPAESGEWQRRFRR